MKRWFVILTVLSLLLLVLLPACGDDEGEKSAGTTPAQKATESLKITVNPTAAAAASEPVKIGAIYPRSGQMAAAGLMYDPIVSLVEWQVKNQGGILGGREVKFIQGDDRGVVADAVAQARKLILEDKVSILTFGGVSSASYDAVADVADELKVPFVALAAISNLKNRKFSADLVGWESNITSYTSHAEFLKPKKVAYLAYDLSDCHYLFDGIETVKGVKERFRASGIELVYEQYYPLGTMDFSPYITKIKYMNPDLLWAGANDPGTAIAMLKQITELGGLGTTKLYFSTSVSVASYTKRPDAEGTYTSTTWVPGSEEPGMKAFGDAYMQKYGKQPDPATSFGYNCFWTAIKAIEMAGTADPEKVAQALRSGNLEWDSAFGLMRIDSNGEGIVQYPLAQVQKGGVLLQVWP